MSTDKQRHSWLGLEAQRAAVTNYLNGGPWRLVAEHTEVESGKPNTRPELQKALAACGKQKGKRIIAKLDRLSRNLAFIAALMDAGVEFIAVDNPHANRLTLQCTDRCDSGYDACIRRCPLARGHLGAHQGRPRGRQGSRQEARRGRDWMKLAGALSQPAARSPTRLPPTCGQSIQASGVSSLRGVARALTARGIRSPRGRDWSDVQVAATLRR